MVARRLKLQLGLVALTALIAVGCAPLATDDTPAPADTAPPTAPASSTPSETAPDTTATEASPPTATSTQPPTEGATATPSAERATPEPTQAPFEPILGLELAAEGLTAPVDMGTAGDGSGRLFIVDQIGVIRVLTAEGELLDEPFLDIRDRMVRLNPGYDERGLLGLAFHPDYETNGLFYVYYSAPLRAGAPSGWNHTSHLSSFAVSGENENRADAASEQVLLQVDQPQGNHNGGEIAFGPEGYLYVALGDGGAANDVGTGHVEDWYEANQGGNGQDVEENLLGSILRIDVDGAHPYAVPQENPFADNGGQGEIWAYGFRNPYRFSFDAEGDRELFVADVGQNLWEEVSIATEGGNYGWNVREGTHCFSSATPNQPPVTCPDADPDGKPLIDPIIEYQNANVPGGLGLSVIGGYVYRGQALPSFQGWYVFGDWSSSFNTGDGALFAAARPATEDEPWSFRELEIATSEDGRLGAFVLGFGQDVEHELYVLTSGVAGPQGSTGKVWKLAPAD